MDAMTTVECIHVYQHSCLQSENYTPEAVTAAYAAGLAALQEKAERENPNPLTLEELRGMNGEPVWLVGVSSMNNFNGNWDICFWETEEVVLFSYCMASPDIRLYGITWTAYRRRPEKV